MARVTIPDIQGMKRDKKQIVVMTAYDYVMACILDRAGVEMFLVGDSGGKYLLGHPDNNCVTMDEMVLMTRSVSRGSSRALVVGDMPFMSYQVNKEEAVRNAGRLIQEGGAQAVKPEVGADYASTVEAIVKAGIPVMAHIGLTPMSTIGSGGWRSEALQIIEEQVWRDVRAMEAAGAFCLLLTRVPAGLARKISEEIRIPIIGVGGDGRIGVTHGTLGFNTEALDGGRSAYGPLAASFLATAQQFIQDVRLGKAPSREQSGG